MLATITIVTAANNHRKFIQNDRRAFDELCTSLERYQQIFLRKSLILASASETEIFLPASLTRIEIQSSEDLGRFLLGASGADIRVIDPAQPVADQQAGPDYFSGRVDFFFRGGDMIATWINGPLASIQIERVANFNNVFDQGVITYVPLAGGIGFMNPAMMTHTLIHSGARILPNDAWRAEPVPAESGQ